MVDDDTGDVSYENLLWVPHSEASRFLVGHQLSATDTVTEAPCATMIFDWDDTLFPTWHICEVVLPCLSGAKLDSDDILPPESPFVPALARHAQIVERTLRAASAYGQVGIVTLGRKHWVKQSAARFLPGLDIDALLDELRIPVVYARRYVEARRFECLDEGVNCMTLAKTIAMKKVLKKHRQVQEFSGNLISIGDSEVERDAVKDLAWGIADETPTSPLCKTVKFLQDPDIASLGEQLNAVSDCLAVMVALPTDFDFCVASNIGLTVELLKDARSEGDAEICEAATVTAF